jgi:putative phage-type endonuclease
MQQRNEYQGTEAWFKAREGKLTASGFAQAAGLGPGSRQQLWRRLMGLEQFHGNEATDWGTENEPNALAAYQAHCVDLDSNVELVGFMVHPEYDWLGASPDLLINADGTGEIKCPMSQVIYPEVPPYYMAQMQGQLEVTNREWCDFIVWTPERMSVRRVIRSREYWQWLHVRIAEFWMYVVAQVEPPRAKKPSPPEISHLVISEKIIEL